MDRQLAVRPVMRWPPQPGRRLVLMRNIASTLPAGGRPPHALIAEFLAVRKSTVCQVVMLDVPFFPCIPLPTRSRTAPWSPWRVGEKKR